MLPVLIQFSKYLRNFILIMKLFHKKKQEKISNYDDDHAAMDVNADDRDFQQNTTDKPNTWHDTETYNQSAAIQAAAQLYRCAGS